MRSFFTKKRSLVALAAIAALAIAGGAYAFFSSTGNGTGSASVGQSTPFNVAQATNSTGGPVFTGGPLYPDPAGTGTAVGNGANVQTDSYTVKNPSAGSQKLNQVVISVAKADGTSWSSQANTLKPACTANDFSVGGQAVGASWTDTSLAGDFTAGQSKTGTVTVEMIDNGLNQDNCQGVTVPLYFSAS